MQTDEKNIKHNQPKPQQDQAEKKPDQLGDSNVKKAEENRSEQGRSANQDAAKERANK